MVITTGSTMKMFWEDTEIWRPGIAFVENMIIRVNGQEIDDPSDIDDSAVVEIVDGDYCCGDYEESLPKFFEVWQKKQVMTRVIVNVPNDKLEEFKALLIKLGYWCNL
jgi:hypothetical protein